jgi:hypothetical protein
MSDPKLNPPDAENEPSQGPNLILIYSLIALALVAAIGFAFLIVLPFYNRR